MHVIFENNIHNAYIYQVKKFENETKAKIVDREGKETIKLRE